MNLGIAHLKAGDMASALTAFRTAATEEPRNADIRMQIGYLLWQQGNLDAALESYQQAARLQPDSVIAHDAIADLYFEQQEVLMTIVAHREVLELAPDHAPSYYHLGVALEARGRRAEAIEALQRAKALLLEQENSEDAQIVDQLLQKLQSS